MFGKKKVENETVENSVVKKKPSKKVVIISVVVAVVVLILIKTVVSASKPMSVMATEVAVEDINQTVDTSGSIKSEETKVYFSPVVAQLGEIKAKKGDVVAKGDILYVYDAADLELQYELADLKVKNVEGGYEDSLMKDRMQVARLGEANMSLEILEQQINDWDAYVKAIEYNIEEKKRALAKEGELLQISLIDWEDQPMSEEYENLRKLVQENSYEQAHNKDIMIWERELADAKKQLAEFESYKSEMRGQKSSSEMGKLTPGGKEQLEASSESSKLEAQNNLDNFDLIKDGVKAEFNGVVAEVSAVEGSTLTKGAQVMTLESTDDVIIEIRLSKYDVERVREGQEVDITTGGNSYTGVVSKVNKIAEKNESGSTVVGAQIKINNPDENVIIGSEAKVKIHAATAAGAMVIPNDAIAYGADGSYVMVIRDGKLVKQFVEIGISDDMRVQVVDGLSAGEQVVTEGIDYLEEGMAVTAILQ